MWSYQGLTEGFKEGFGAHPYYPDHFHEFRDLAKVILFELERNAYQAIAEEEQRARVLDSAKSDKLFNKSGNLQDITAVKEAILTSFELMKELSHEKIVVIVKKLEERVDEFLLYFKKAKEVCEMLFEKIDNREALRGLCLAWQWDHKFHQVNKAKQRDYYKKEREFWLSYVEGLLGKNIEGLQQETFRLLDTV